MIVLSDSKARMIVSSFLWTKQQNLMDRRAHERTDRQTDLSWLLQRSVLQAIRTRCKNCMVADYLQFVRDLLALFGKRRLAFLHCTLSGKRVAFCCIINIIRQPDNLSLASDPALRHQVAQRTCFYAAEDECARPRTANQHNLIGSSALRLPLVHRSRAS